MSSSYSTGRLCTEDPISVSRKFSEKFHDFFNTVVQKGEVLGKVTHHFFKKEYQAPHYHILLWIEGAPVAGSDDGDVVLQWIQEKITNHFSAEKARCVEVFDKSLACRIPEESSCTSWSPSTSSTSATTTAGEGHIHHSLKVWFSTRGA